MRDWHLTADGPLSMRYGADVRLGRTDYADDQSWEIVFGNPQEPALAFQTRYGGRAGLARLVPMWVVAGKPVYEGAGFVERPALRAFTPNYAKVTARPLATLNLTAELWVMESHAVGGRFTMENTGTEPVNVQLEMFAQVVREGQMVEMNLLSLEDGTEALHLGAVGNLNPVLALEGAMITAPQAGGHVSPKLGVPMTIAPGATGAVRWVHAGRTSLGLSLQTAFQWLQKNNWDAALRQIERINESVPLFETGNPDWDAALAFGSQLVLRSFIGPTGQLPYPSFVSARIPSRGFSARGDGSDQGWQWNGQSAALGFLAIPATAMIAPDLARGTVRNAIAVQQADGWIDNKPGLGGQRSRELSLPLLATIAWRVYEVTEDRTFIAEVLPGLQRFFERWFQPDMDRDQDGLPEWSSTTQSAYADNPIFARFRRWAQNADISKAEAPDLAVYLIREAYALQQMADMFDRSDIISQVQVRLDSLLTHLYALWNDGAGSYRYRDRDTHLTPTGTTLFRGKGDETFSGGARLDPPNHLILRAVGGKDYAPRLSATIEGIDAKGQPVAESVPTSAFAWHYGAGAAVSEHAYSQINYVRLEGLSRVYSIEIDSVDLTRMNQTLLTPLWTGTLDKDRAVRLIQTILDQERYWRPFGIPVCPKNDPAYAPNNDGGSGGVWMLWNTLMAEGMLHYEKTSEAATLFSRLMDAQVRALRRDHAFREAYNSETGEGLGDLDELGGVMPLHLVMQMIGLRVINRRRLYAGGLFAFSRPVKITQYGIEITRSADGTVIRFPSGYTATVDEGWQLIEDPTPEPPPVPEVVSAPAPIIEPMVEPTGDLPGPASVIPVDARKTDTMEIPVNLLDIGQEQPKPPRSTDSSGGIKIPVKGPQGDE